MICPGHVTRSAIKVSFVRSFATGCRLRRDYAMAMDWVWSGLVWSGHSGFISDHFHAEREREGEINGNRNTT